MHSIGIFDCITGQGWLVDLANRSLYLDGISSWFGKKRFRVIHIDSQTTYLEQTVPFPFSFLNTCLKIVLISSLVFPTLMLLVKWQNLKAHRFVIRERESLSSIAPSLSIPLPLQTPIKQLNKTASENAAPPATALARPTDSPNQPIPWPIPQMPPPLFDKPPYDPSQKIVPKIVEEPLPEVCTTPPEDALKDLLDGLANDPHEPCWKKMKDELSPTELLKNLESYKKAIFKKLTPDLLRSKKEYAHFYRTIRTKHPLNSFFPELNLKDSLGKTVAVDRLLACLASPVLEAACRSSMKESLENSYKSPLFDDLLEPIADFIQSDKLPPLSPQTLIAIYKASDQLQMSIQPTVREKLRLHLLHNNSLSIHDLLEIWSLAETHQDISLRLLVLHHLFTFHKTAMKLQPLPATLNEQYTLFTELKAYPFEFKMDSHPLQLSFPTLNPKILELCQKLEIENLEIKSLFGPTLAKAFKSIKSLTLADQNQYDLPASTLAALLENPSLRLLNLSYCNLDEECVQVLTKALSANTHLTSLSLIAIPFTPHHFADLTAALHANTSITHLQLNHCSLNDTSLNLLQNVMEKKPCLQVSLKSNKFSSKPLNLFINTFTNRILS